VNYISDTVIFTLRSSAGEVTNGETISIAWEAIYSYDGTTADISSVDMYRDGVLYEAGATDSVELRSYDAQHTFDIRGFTDDSYGITDYTTTELTLKWESSGGSGGDDDDDIIPAVVAYFGSNPGDWFMIMVTGMAVGYVVIYGAGSYGGIPIAQRGISSLKDWILEIIEGDKRQYRKSGRSATRSTGRSGKLGSFSIKMPTKWPSERARKPRTTKRKK